MVSELSQLTKNVDHIKAIISTQQSFTGVAGLSESVELCNVMDEVLRLREESYERHHIDVTREYEDLPSVVLEKHKLLQILVNLVANACESLIECGRRDKQLVIRLRHVDKDKIRIEVCDNGVGLSEDASSRVFAFGFTTKKDGHGFGLHHSAIAAKELGGALTLQSDGPNAGAVCALEIPLNSN